MLTEKKNNLWNVRGVTCMEALDDGFIFLRELEGLGGMVLMLSEYS